VRSALCTWRRQAWVSWLSLKTNVDGLSVVWPQNHWDDFSSVWASKPMATIYEQFGLKTTQMVFTGLSSKPVSTAFCSLASKLVAMVFSSLASKLVAMVSPDLASKPRWWRVFRFVPQNRQLQFDDLGFKITATVSYFGPQNKVGFGLSVVSQNRRREVGVGHASRFRSLFHVEASRDKVFQSGLKTSGGATAGGARDIITEVASEAS
jgi:hypothetical protein